MADEEIIWKDLKIQRIKDEVLDSNCYFIMAENGKIIIIDPNRAAEAEQILSENSLAADFIILTHEHYDHIAGVSRFRELSDAPILCSKQCAAASRNPRTNLSQIFGVQLHFLGTDQGEKVKPYVCPPADIVFDDEKQLLWGDHVLFMTRTPGHTEGSITIVLDDHIVFSGDSLIKNHDVIIRKRGGSLENYRKVTIPFYKRLQKDCLVCPGHGELFELRDKQPIFQGERKNGIL